MFHRIMPFTIALLLTGATLAMAVTTRGATLPQTGQTTSYSAGDDGALQMGIPAPNPRFTDNINGIMTDNLTGLIWLKNANCFSSQVWATAMTSAASLASGACGLSDSSIAGQWRLPNVIELESLLNEQQVAPYTWLNSQGFTGVQGNDYWSSSTFADTTKYAWYVYMDGGVVGNGSKFNINYVWPVRGGQ